MSSFQTLEFRIRSLCIGLALRHTNLIPSAVDLPTVSVIDKEYPQSSHMRFQWSQHVLKTRSEDVELDVVLLARYRGAPVHRPYM